MLPITVLMAMGLGPTATTDTVIETLPDGSTSITSVPREPLCSDPAVEPAPAPLAVPAYSRLRWAALVGLVPDVVVDLVPELAVPAIPLIAEDAREWLLGHPMSAELRADVLRAPLDLDLVAAAVAHGRATGAFWDPRPTCRRLGLVQETPSSERGPDAAHSTWSAAQALAIQGLVSLARVAENLSQAIGRVDRGRVAAARLPLEPAMDNALRRVREWEGEQPAVQSPGLARSWEL